MYSDHLAAVADLERQLSDQLTAKDEDIHKLRIAGHYLLSFVPAHVTNYQGDDAVLSQTKRHVEEARKVIDAG